MMNVLGIDIHTYLVKDPARATAFYRDVMGFNLIMEYEGMGAEFELPDGAIFGLWKPDGDMPWQPSQGIMFAVPDINAAVKELRSKGCEVSDPHEFPPCFMAFTHDTEGNQLILHHRKDGTHS